MRGEKIWREDRPLLGDGDRAIREEAIVWRLNLPKEIDHFAGILRQEGQGVLKSTGHPSHPVNLLVMDGPSLEIEAHVSGLCNIRKKNSEIRRADSVGVDYIERLKDPAAD